MKLWMYHAACLCDVSSELTCALSATSNTVHVTCYCRSQWHQVSLKSLPCYRGQHTGHRYLHADQWPQTAHQTACLGHARLHRRQMVIYVTLRCTRSTEQFVHWRCRFVHKRSSAMFVFVWISVLTLSLPIPLRLYTLPYWSNPPFLIFDIWALWRSVLSARAPECQKLKMVG